MGVTRQVKFFCELIEIERRKYLEVTLQRGTSYFADGKRLCAAYFLMRHVNKHAKQRRVKSTLQETLPLVEYYILVL